MIQEISKYAPNVSWDIVNGYVPVTPHFTSGFARNYGAAGNQDEQQGEEEFFHDGGTGVEERPTVTHRRGTAKGRRAAPHLSR